MSKGIGPSFFTNNRRRLREVCKEDIPIVVPAHGLVQKSRDEAFPFHQENNFWYLCGVNEPNFILVIDENEEYLIAPQTNDYLTTFSGAVDRDKIKTISGIDKVFDNKEGWSLLAKRLETAKGVSMPEVLPAYIDQLGMYTNPAGQLLVEKLKSYKPGLNLADIRPYLASLRSIKSSEEIELIQRSTDASIKLHFDIAGRLSEFKLESDLIRFIKKSAAEAGLHTAYEPIVAGGENACILHYENGQDGINPGMPLLVDAALSYGRYRSDITRTYCTKPSNRFKALHSAVILVQEFAINLLKPGIILEEYEKAIRQFMCEKLRESGLIDKIDEKLVSKYYPHRTSHFLGLDAHDPGDPNAPLKPGMVLTVEPGIYLKDESIGIRVEDVVLITEQGNRVLSAKLPKDVGVS